MRVPTACTIRKAVRLPIKQLVEFDFRYSTRKVSDVERAEELLRGTKGKRLMYR